MGQGRETKGPAPYKGIPRSRIRGLTNIDYHLSQPESDRLRLVLNIRDTFWALEAARRPNGTPRGPSCGHVLPTIFKSPNGVASHITRFTRRDASHNSRRLPTLHVLPSGALPTNRFQQSRRRFQQCITLSAQISPRLKASSIAGPRSERSRRVCPWHCFEPAFTHNAQTISAKESSDAVNRAWCLHSVCQEEKRRFET